MKKKITMIYMAGMGCLNCGKGHYEGYSPQQDYRKATLTTPCTKCGDIQRGRINKKVFLRKVSERDERLYSGIKLDIPKMKTRLQ